MQKMIIRNLLVMSVFIVIFSTILMYFIQTVTELSKTDEICSDSLDVLTAHLEYIKKMSGTNRQTETEHGIEDENEHFISMISSAKVSSGGYIFAVNGKSGVITYHPNGRFTGLIFKDYYPGDINERGFLTLGEINYRYASEIYAPFKGDSQILIAVVPEDELFADRAMYTIIFFFVMVVFFGVFCTIVGLDIKAKMTNGLYKTVESLERVAAGNLDVVVDVKGCEELEYLSSGINAMISTIKTKLKEISDLSESRKQLGAIVELADSGIVVKDSFGFIRDWNIGAENITGYKSADTIGKQVKDISAPEDHEFLNRVEKTIARGEHITHIEIKKLKKDGNFVYCSCSFTPIYNDAGNYTGSVEIFQDISEKKTIEKELESAVAAAEEALSVKSAFLANISHEIRTPMNVIIGMVDILQEEALTRRQMKFIRDIKNSSENLLDIVNDILDFSKIEASKFSLVPVNYDLYELLDNIDTMFKQLAKKKNLKYISERENNLPRYLFGDDIRVNQILQNLLSNAIKFTPDGSVKLLTTADNENIRFEVTDTGMGIKEENLERLFEPFTQVDTTANRKAAGTGLGLSIIKNIVSTMDGFIKVSSIYGQGSTFTVTLPRVEGSAEKVLHKISSVVAEQITAPLADILVVDDSELNLKVASGLLEMSDIICDTALSGAEAIEKVKEKDYDIIFMDHMMASMDGIETTRRIRALGDGYGIDERAIVALTANAVEGVREMLISAGMNDFLSKPINKSLLTECLKKWLPPEKISPKPEKEKSESKAAYNKVIDFIGKNESFDVNRALDLMGGSVELYIDTIRLTTKNMPAILKKLSNLLESGDIEHFSIGIHGAKNSLATIGAYDLSATAFLMETRSKAGDAAFCREHLPDFTDKAAALFGLLESALLKEEGALLPNGDLAALKAETEEIRRCLNEFDDDNALMTVADIIKYDYGEEINALLKILRNKIEIFEYQDASESLDKLEKILE